MDQLMVDYVTYVMNLNVVYSVANFSAFWIKYKLYITFRPFMPTLLYPIDVNVINVFLVVILKFVCGRLICTNISNLNICRLFVNLYESSFGNLSCLLNFLNSTPCRCETYIIIICIEYIIKKI